MVVISQARHDAVWEELNQLRNFRNYIRGALALNGNEPTIRLIEELEMFEKRTHEAEKRYYEKESGPTKPNPILNPRSATIRPNVERQMVTSVPYEVFQAVLKELDQSRKWIKAAAPLVESDQVVDGWSREKVAFPERNVTIQRMAGTYDATMRRPG